MEKNYSRLRELFLSRHGKEAMTSIPTQDEIERIRSKIFVKFKDKDAIIDAIIDEDVFDHKIMQDLETLVVYSNKWKLTSKPDFGCSIDTLRIIREHYDKIISSCNISFEPKPLQFFLNQLLVLQLELELDMTKTEFDETKEEQQSKQDKIKKAVEEREIDFKRAILSKESDIETLKNKVATLQSKNDTINSQFEKVISSKLDDKKQVETLQEERKAIEEKIDNLTFQKEKLERELHEINTKSNSSEQVHEVEIARLKREIEKAKAESSKVLNEQKKSVEEINKLREMASTLKKQNNALQTATANNMAQESLDIYLICVDLNNIERSLNKNEANLRLFDINAFFKFVHSVLIKTTANTTSNISSLYNVIGHVFCSPQNMKFKQPSISGNDDESNDFASLFEWHETRFKKGKITGTSKDKNQDTDPMLTGFTGNIIGRYGNAIKALYLASGDIDDWSAISDVINANKLQIPIHIIGKKECINQVIIKTEKFIHYL